MSQKTRQQWLGAIRRWSVVGAVVGLVAGLVLPALLGEGPAAVLGSVAFYLPMGMAMALILWASVYRYEFPQVWGGRQMALTFLLIGILMAVSIGAGCAQGICGEP